MHLRPSRPFEYRSGQFLRLFKVKDEPDLTGWRVYLCGNPQMVNTARIEAFLAGAASSEIFADPFLPTGTPTAPALNPH